MGRPATFEELRQILSERSADLQRQLKVADAQLGIPTDGKGLRIQVSIRPGTAVKIPEVISFELADGSVDVTLEVIENYQQYKPL